MPFEYKQFYRRKLPHRHAPGSTLFITFRLAGAVPKPVLKQWKLEKDYIQKQFERAKKVGDENLESVWTEFHRNWFAKFESILDQADHGPVWLKDDRIAQLVFDSILHRNDREYSLFAFSIMSNHVHVVFRPLLDERSVSEVPLTAAPRRFVSTSPTLAAIMQSLKGYTAREANKLLGRTGQFWDAESYDHEIRNKAEFQRIVRYVLTNPVKAGIVSHWEDHRWTWKRTAEKATG